MNFVYAQKFSLSELLRLIPLWDLSEIVWEVFYSILCNLVNMIWEPGTTSYRFWAPLWCKEILKKSNNSITKIIIALLFN